VILINFKGLFLKEMDLLSGSLDSCENASLARDPTDMLLRRAGPELVRRLENEGVPPLMREEATLE
jgi:hypothetical protein